MSTLGEIRRIESEATNRLIELSCLILSLENGVPCDLITREKAEGGRRYDALVGSPGFDYVLNVKVYRQLNISDTLVGMAIAQTLPNDSYRGTAILVVSAVLSEFAKNTAKGFGIKTIDWNDITSYIDRNPEHKHIYDAVANDLGLYFSVRVPSEEELAQKYEKIDAIISKIESAKSGQKGFDEFEKACIEGLTSLFEEDISWARRQNENYTKTQRSDYLVKINSTKGFWVNLCTDFNTRYVIFEFKNYKNRLSSANIYMTGKYLMASAKRSVAFVIAKNGFQDNCVAVSHEVLRSSGCLIVNIPKGDLVAMLNMQKESKDYYEVISGLVDGVLSMSSN